MHSCKGVLLGGLVAFAAMFAPASALAIRYEIQLGLDGGLGFSRMHGATRDTGGTAYAGEPYLTWSGSLNADLSGSIYEFGPSLLTGTARPGNSLGYRGHWTLRITGGELNAAAPYNTLMGSLTYELRDDRNELYDSGAFHLVNRGLGGESTSVLFDGIALFGWNQHDMSRADLVISGNLPPGTDSGGTPIPEPASLALLGTALVGGWLARRRRSGLRA